MATIDFSVPATRRLAAQVERFWNRSSSVTGLGVFGFLLTVLVILRCQVGLRGTTYYSHDGFLVLDGAWRMLNGQRPHVDFNSMIGPAAYLPTVIGFRLSSNTASGLAYGQALVAFVLGIWTYLLGRKLYEIPRVVCALWVAAIAVSPALLGFSPFGMSPGVTYNRYLYALIGVLLVECLSTEVESEFKAGLSTGAVIGILAFLKVTGFLVAVLLVLVLMPQRVQSYRRWAGISSGAALVAVAFLCYLHFDVASVVRDLAITAAAKHIRFTELYLLNSIALEAGIGLLLALSASSLLIDSEQRTAGKNMLIAGGAVVAASVLVILSNFQPSELPLLAFFLVIAGQKLVENRRATAVAPNTITALVIGSGALFAGITVISAFLSLASAEWRGRHSVRAANRFDTRALREFVPVSHDAVYTQFVNDGFRLLQQYRRPGERVMSLDFANPFSYGLWIPPAPGGSTNLQYDGSFNDKHQVSAEKLFGAADLVMLPKLFSDESLQSTVPRIYGPYLKSHFRLVADTWFWQLYRRDSSTSPAGAPNRE